MNPFPAVGLRIPPRQIPLYRF